MADLVLVIGESGHNIDFVIQSDSGVVDISEFDTITLKIKTSDFVTESLSKALSKPNGGTDGLARWAVTSGNIPTTAGLYLGQIILTDTGVQTRKTQIFDIEVVEKLD